MPMMDMPIQELKCYLGKGNYPSDFIDYWNRQIARLNERDLEYELVKKEFLNECADYYELYFKGIDGARIHAKYICPKNRQNVPLILQFHDYKQSSKSWYHLTRYIGIGYAVLAMDCRGQGGMSEDLGGVLGTTVCGHLMIGIDDELDQMYYRKVYLDAYLLSKIGSQLPQIDTKKIVSYGQGQGGALAIVVAAMNKEINKCVAKDPFLADFKRVWEMDLDSLMYEGLRYYFRWFDPLHEREDEVFSRLGYLDVVHFAKQLNCKFLLGTGLLDSSCPPSTQYAIFNQAMCNKMHLVFAKFDHELCNRFEDEVLRFIQFEEGCV